MYPKVESREQRERKLYRVSARAVSLASLPEQHGIDVKVHVVHDFMLSGIHLESLAHLEHKVCGQADNGRDDEGKEDRLSGMCEQKIGTASVRMSVEMEIWK